MTKQRLRDTWLIHKHEAAVLGLIYVAMTAVWLGFGLLLTHPLKNSFIVHNDQSVSEWFVRHRTTRLNSLSFAGSMLSDTVAKIAVTAVVAIVFLLIWKRWLEPLTVVIPTILEAMCFITVTWIVGRPRPDVPHLDTSPVGSSYPSGHTGAAAAYFAIVVVIFWHTRRTWIRALVTTVAVLIPIVVALARMYRGMHFLTDVVFGALLGTTSVIASVLVLRRAAERYGQVDTTLEGWGHEDELARSSADRQPVS
jgi:membrane-associated phospholipid phosphatase